MIPVNEPLFSNREKELLGECIDTGWVSSEGPFVRKFEKMFASYAGVEHGIAVCNGTAALDVAMNAINLKPGEEVIMPAFTIISCAIAVVTHGGIPVLADVEPDTWCMDASQVEARITPRTRAIMPVHMYGHPADMDPVMALAEKYNLYVIEDAAEAHGAEYKGKKCGSIGHISAFSFYANKIITTGEGGMVLTGSSIMAERARSYRNLCFGPDRQFNHPELGRNYRMTNLQAAVGVAQMERIDEFIGIKRRNAALYTELLSNIQGIQLPVERPWAKNVYWMYGIVIDKDTGIDAKSMANELKTRDVGTRPFFTGMHKQPALQNMGLFKGERYPVSEEIARQGLYLPSGLTLTETQIEKVCTAIKEIMEA